MMDVEATGESRRFLELLLSMRSAFVRRGVLGGLAIALTVGIATAQSPRPTTQSTTQTYDIVIVNGHVMDPESGLDAVRNIGISGETIEEITAEPIQGRTTIDARGLVVAPGFIDLHQHDH